MVLRHSRSSSPVTASVPFYNAQPETGPFPLHIGSHCYSVGIDLKELVGGSAAEMFEILTRD